MSKGFENETQSTQKILSATFNAPIPTWGIVLIALVSCLLMMLILVGLILSLVILMKKWIMHRQRHLSNVNPDSSLPDSSLPDSNFPDLVGSPTSNNSTNSSCAANRKSNLYNASFTRNNRDYYAASLAIAPDDYYIGPHGGGLSSPLASLVLTPENPPEANEDNVAIDVDSHPVAAVVSHPVANSSEPHLQPHNIGSMSEPTMLEPNLQPQSHISNIINLEEEQTILST